MTWRASPAELERADEMRVRILGNPEAWRVLSPASLRRPRDYDPREFTCFDDHWDTPLNLRDPRAIEAELDARRVAFWNAGRAGLVRFAARRAVELSRHLDTREVVAA